MKTPLAKAPRLSPLAWALLRFLRDAPGPRTTTECERVAERLFKDATLAHVRVKTAAALCALEKQGVVQLTRRKGTAPDSAAARRTLPAVTRAALMLSKPCAKERHALSLSRQPQHEQRGAALPDKPEASGGGSASVDAGAVSGPHSTPGPEAAPASPTQETRADAVLDTPQSTNDAPEVVTVAIKAPRRARP